MIQNHIRAIHFRCYYLYLEATIFLQL